MRVCMFTSLRVTDCVYIFVCVYLFLCLCVRARVCNFLKRIWLTNCVHTFSQTLKIKASEYYKECSLLTNLVRPVARKCVFLMCERTIVPFTASIHKMPFLQNRLHPPNRSIKNVGT